MASAAVQTLKDILPALDDGDKYVRYDALTNLLALMWTGGLEPGVLVHHIVPMLDDEDWMVREYAVRAFEELEPRVLADNADSIVPRLNDENWMVRERAVQLLGNLEPEVLPKYAHNIVSAIGDENEDVRFVALKNMRAVMETVGLKPGVLAEYVDNIVPRLEDEFCCCRVFAIQALLQFEPEVIAKNVHLIVPRLDDEDERVRSSAIQALGNLKPEVLADYAGDISRMLTDEDEYVRLYALRTLFPLGPHVHARYVRSIAWCLIMGDGYSEDRIAVDVLTEVPSVALVPHRYTLQTLEFLNEQVWDKFRSLRGRMWLVRLRQLFWCKRFLWWWGSRACGPGSRQACPAASEFGRMQGVSVEEEGEREVKRARVV